MSTDTATHEFEPGHPIKELCRICNQVADVHYAKAANPSLPDRASEWQPIETAPRNESVLVYIPNAGRAVGDRQPTHWMPLPEPPKEAI